MLLPLHPDELARVRIVTSAWWEVVAAVSTILKETPLHHGWIKSSLAAMRQDPTGAEHWDWLRTFIMRTGTMADALTPSVLASETFEQTRERVRTQDLSLWAKDLAWARRRAERPASLVVLDTWEADPRAGLDRLLAAVDWFWKIAVEPHWSRIVAVQQADIDFRLREIAAGGLDQMLAALHPQVGRVERGLEISGKTCDLGCGDQGRGLVLVPSVFAWPGTMVLSAPGFIKTLSYSPRGAGVLWEQTPEAALPLAQLLGATRAGILAQLDVPMTTSDLACQHDVAKATANAHLKVMLGAGLLRTMRRGKEVLYARTQLGDSLAGAPALAAVS